VLPVTFNDASDYQVTECQTIGLTDYQANGLGLGLGLVRSDPIYLNQATRPVQ